MKINLLSDTVTRPTAPMLEMMLKASVGDDVHKSDPTVNKLQKKVAKLFGREDALFFPSGTMANQTAIKLHSEPGDRLFCHKYSHIYNYESGGVAFNSGVTCQLLEGERGMFSVQELERVLGDRRDIYVPRARLVCVENTTNKGGGACWDFYQLQKIKKVVEKNKLSFHLDGARLFNALVKKGETPQQYGKLFDTISICLSKGLGAPVGSLLIGDKKFINKALRIRKILGGGMRQVGYLAAAGIYALDYQFKRLDEDHKKAQAIARVLETCSYVNRIETVETNIIIFYLNKSSSEKKFLQKMKKKDILISSMGEGKIRIVTHLDFTKEMQKKLFIELKSF